MKRAMRWTLGLCALVCGGCVPLVPLEQFISVANGFALSPERSCVELAEAFDLPAVEVDTPADVGFAFIEEQIQVGDRTLRGWFIPAEAPLGVVVFSYGAVGDMSCYLWIVLNLLERGWSVAMYDFTGFGGSTGTPSLLHLTEDGRAAIDWARELSGVDQVVLMGVSLGTIPTIQYAADYPEAVAGAIVDGPISLQAEVERFAFLFGFNTAPYIALLPEELLMAEQIPDVQAPLLVYSYGFDEFATGRIAVDLTSRTAGHVTQQRFQDLPHVRGPYFAAGEYFRVLADFLRARLSDPSLLPKVDLGPPQDFVPRPALAE